VEKIQMKSLTFGSYASIVKENWSPNSTNETIVAKLFGCLAEDYKKTYCLVDESLAGKLISGKRDVPKAIRERAAYKNIVSDLEPFFKKAILYHINPAKFPLIVAKIQERIQRDGLNDVFITDGNPATDSDAFSEFLFLVFMYTLSVDNQTLPDDEMPYVEEVCGKCPLCGESLVSQYGSNFKVVKFESGNNDSTLSSFKTEKTRPDRIALCLIDAEKAEKDLKGFQPVLLAKKKLFCEKTKEMEILSKETVEDDILKVLESLGNVGDVGLLPKFTEAKKLDKKISKNITPFRMKVGMYVSAYYNFVNDTLSGMTSGKTNFFRSLSAKIQLQAVRLEGLGISKEAIFDDLTDWLLQSPGLNLDDRSGCEAVVSFFVQNCEVF